jgi:hypothetical protein
MDEHVDTVDEPRCVGGVANVAAELFDGALELGVVEGSDVESPNEVPVSEQPAGKVQAEKAGAARNRPKHARSLALDM